MLEHDFRDFLYSNPSVIEEGLESMGKEVSTKCGRIDLLFKDKEGKHVLAELKTSPTSKSVPQVVRYASAYLHANSISRDKIRLMVVCPEESGHLRTCCELSGVEFKFIREIPLELALERLKEAEKTRQTTATPEHVHVEQTVSSKPFELELFHTLHSFIVSVEISTNKKIEGPFATPDGLALCGSEITFKGNLCAIAGSIHFGILPITMYKLFNEKIHASLNAYNKQSFFRRFFPVKIEKTSVLIHSVNGRDINADTDFNLTQFRLQDLLNTGKYREDFADEAKLAFIEDNMHAIFSSPFRDWWGKSRVSMTREDAWVDYIKQNPCVVESDVARAFTYEKPH